MAISILVVPGTGKQGSATAKALKRIGAVHILARNTSSPVAQSLASDGVVVHEGDLGDKDSIREALQSIDAVFLALPAHPTSEVSFASNIIEAAEEAGVNHIVYSSVARAGQHERFPGWSLDASKYAMNWYWLNKADIEMKLRQSSIPLWTILQPAFFMSNFTNPDCTYMFPDLSTKHELRVAFTPQTRLHLIDVDDIANVAAQAISSPNIYKGKVIPLAAEALTADEIAQCLTTATEKKINVIYLTDEEVLEHKRKGYVAMDSQIWQRQVGYGIDLSAVHWHGSLTSFGDMLKSHGTGW